jgi:AmmeMemoRadiSam system protein B
MSDALPHVKAPQLAGRWYPADAGALRATVEQLLAAAGPPGPDVVAVLVPHAAYQYSGAVAAHAFAAAAGAPPARAIVLAPSHFAAFRGAAVLPLAGYRTPLGVVSIDGAALDALAATPLVRRNPAVFMREHAVEIQLPWLQVLAPGCAVVPVLVGTLEPGDAETLAGALRPLVAPGTLVVVSSDLVHYGARFDYVPVPPTDAATVAAAVRRIDGAALAAIEAGDAGGFVRTVEETGATICGRHAIAVLLHALPRGVRGRRLAYATSLEATGEHDHSVSYAAVAFVREAA